MLAETEPFITKCWSAITGDISEIADHNDKEQKYVQLRHYRLVGIEMFRTNGGTTIEGIRATWGLPSDLSVCGAEGCRNWDPIMLEYGILTGDPLQNSPLVLNGELAGITPCFFDGKFHGIIFEDEDGNNYIGSRQIDKCTPDYLESPDAYNAFELIGFSPEIESDVIVGLAMYFDKDCSQPEAICDAVTSFEFIGANDQNPVFYPVPGDPNAVIGSMDLSVKIEPCGCSNNHVKYTFVEFTKDSGTSYNYPYDISDYIAMGTSELNFRYETGYHGGWTINLQATLYKENGFDAVSHFYSISKTDKVTIQSPCQAQTL